MTLMGRKIQDRRKERGLTRLALAELVGVTDRTILRLEVENRDFSLSLVKRVSEILEVPLSYLVKTEKTGEECLEYFLMDILKKCYIDEFANDLKVYGPYILHDEYKIMAQILLDQLSFFISKAKVRMIQENFADDDSEEMEIFL